jgi:two-component system NarL family response regulator
VGAAKNGREGIDLFRIHKPDVTLMDLQMPVMNGLDAILAIRQESPSARIIVLTSYSGDEQAIRALKAGAAGYLLKSMLGTGVSRYDSMCALGRAPDFGRGRSGDR